MGIFLSNKTDLIFLRNSIQFFCRPNQNKYLVDKLKLIMIAKSENTKNLKKNICELLGQMEKINASLGKNHLQSSFTKEKIGEFIARICLCQEYKNANGVKISTLDKKISDLLDYLKEYFRREEKSIKYDQRWV